MAKTAISKNDMELTDTCGMSDRFSKNSFSFDFLQENSAS